MIYHQEPEEYTVVVTAYGPWKNTTHNPVQDVKLAIPDVIERPGKTPIRIIKYSHDLRNAIKDMDLIAELWTGKRGLLEPGVDGNDDDVVRVDAMLHLGMADRDIYTVESNARRDGYEFVGDDGIPLPKKSGGIGGRWQGLPWLLTPFFDVDAVAGQIEKDVDVRAERSDKAGGMYCEFLLYESLAAVYRRGEAARALFLHHPEEKNDEAGTQEGAVVAVSVICSMIDQLNSK